MYNNPKQLSDTLLEAMQIISNNNISKTDYGTTIQGNIVECKDPSIGKYLVKYQDSLMEAYSTSPSVQYPKNTTVYLFATNGRLGDLKIILGSTKQLGSNYIEEYMGQEYYDTSNNFIEDNDYVIELCSYQTKEQDIYSIEENENKPNVISLSDNIIQKLQNSNYLKISGTIQTNLSYKQKYYGRYGIRVTLLMKNSATGNTEEQDYYFDSNNFNGNPYEYRVPSTQSVSYPIDSSNFVAVSRITAFIQGFPNQIQEGAEAPAADIFISNLTLNGSYRLSETEKNTIGVILTAPKGYIFTKDNVLTDTRPVKAGLRAKMKQVDLEEQGAQVYWFKEDLNINTMSPGYLRIGGLGWRCINPASATDNPLVYQFEPSITIDIKKEDVQFTKESKFKCVIRYDNKSYTKQFIIFNNGASRQVTLESTAGTSFSCSAGHPNLICRIWETDKEKQDITKREDEDGNKIFTFKWQVCNSQNVTKILEQDSEEEIQEYKEDKETLEKINAILNGVEEEPKEESDDDENSYKKTLKARLNINKEVDQIPYEEFIEALQERIRKYEGDQHIDGNILYSLDLHQIIDYSVFKCSCYEGDTCYGTANITIKNTQVPNDGYVLTINNGDQVFLYNEEGTSLHSVGLDQPYSIRDLSFSLFHNGEEISQEDLKNGVAPTWKVPLKDTMLEIGATENSSDENYKYIIGQTLPIDVKNVYNPSLSNNDIYLILQYKDLVLTTKTNFGFSKEGELGTNGTKYQFKITTDTPIIKYNIYQEEGKKIPRWEKNQIILTPELWCNGQKQSEISNMIDWNILKNNLNKDKNGEFAEEWSYLNNGKDDENTKKRIIDLNDEGILNIPNQNLVNIIQATLTGPEGYKYYSVLSFVSIYEYFDNNDYQVQFNLDSGFRTVVYKSDGTQPKYDNRLPFEVNIYKKFANGNERENITLQKKENFTFKWEVTDKEDLEDFETDSVNKYRVNPKSVLKNGNRVTDGVLLYIEKDKKPFAYVHIPIYLMLNRYENAAMNDWDGTSIEINENGYILTPQIGAGIKTKDTKNNNAFTGVLLGTERIKTQETETENSKIEDRVGLFGYAAGARSIFLDAQTGNAQFGLPDKGQIKIDVEDQAIIQSGDYPKKKGDPKKGMRIKFSGDPQITFGSGNFSVNSEGHIHAAGGGDIANWEVSDNGLYYPNNGTKPKNQGTANINNSIVGMSPYNTYDNNEYYTGVFWAGAPDTEIVNKKEKNIIQTINGDNFYQRNFFVTQGGYLFSKRGQIAGWNITEKMLNKKYDVKIENEKGEVKQSIEYSVGMQSGKGLSFWAGPTGNYNFYVKSDGYLFSKKGHIGGWKIFADKLTNEAENVGISSGIKLDKVNDIRTVCFWSGNANKDSSYSTENMNFYVDTTGFLFSKYGQIGNWFIGSGGLYHQLGKAKIEITLPYSYNKRIIRLRQERDKTTKKGTEKYDDFNKRIKKIQKDIKDGKIKGTDRAVETITTKTFDNTIDINYENSQGGVYVGSDGIRLGEIFHVDSNGLYASKGNIGGIDITLDGLYATNWQITGDGTATFAGATINGSSINKALAISGSSGGGGISGGGMHMGASGSGPGSSSISPDVMAQGKGKTWDAYIDEKIKNAIDSMSKSAVIKALKDGGSSIDFRDLTVTAEKFNGHNMEKSGSDLATESYVDSKIKSVTPTTPTTPTTP